jgi:holliday junction DNA helicase RuvA
MISYLKGQIVELNPTSIILDVNGVGYFLGVSLQTSNKLSLNQSTKLQVQQIIREDAHLLFGFSHEAEKAMFNLLISVSGVGAVSALLILSSYEIQEIANYIMSANSPALQKVKGVGAKTAERIIIDLRDKVQKFADENYANATISSNNIKDEALNALEVLGIPKRTAEKIADKVLKQQPDLGVEALLKIILKNL